MKKQQPERNELERVTSSREFSRATQLRSLLIWLCEKKLAGDMAALTEYAIGVGPLGRKSDFDPRIDAIVRKEMARLREKLNEYYERNQESSLRIIIEKGSYDPRFEERRSAEKRERAEFRILILPFEEKGAADGHLTEELIELFVAKPHFRVAPQVLSEHCRQRGVFPMEPLRKAGVDWLIEGVLRQEEGERMAGVRLISVVEGFAVASWRLRGDGIAEQIVEVVEEKLRSIEDRRG